MNISEAFCRIRDKKATMAWRPDWAAERLCVPAWDPARKEVVVNLITPTGQYSFIPHSIDVQALDWETD